MDRLEILPGVFATRYYAAYVEEYRMAVIADLHLGYEGALHDQGVSIPRRQKAVMLKRLGSMISDLQPRTLVVAGDFKHEFSRPIRDEWNEVLDVLEFLNGRTDVVLVRGNHDNFLRNILNRKAMELHKDYWVGNFRVLHGHEDFELEGITIMGHEHPSLKLRDEVGATTSVPCFLALDNLVVVPAFSPLAYGTDIFERPYLSPVLNRLKMSAARVIGVDDEVGLLDFHHMGDIRR